MSSYPFLLPLGIGILCEITKVLVETYETGNWKGGLFRAGGMPSTHSAMVTSLMIIVGYDLGVHSVEFAITVIFACIVWYDATHSRREVGELAKVLNVLQKEKALVERTGHSIREVVGGIGFGIALSCLGLMLLPHF